jgi:riboflavin kinase/FMN adenylyltransferase
VEAARVLLGRPFAVEGLVVRGAGRGRTLGIPTANLETANETLPGRGVYAAVVRLPEGRATRAVVNVGRRPTFGGGETTVEAHLLDFDQDLYGLSLRLEFHRRLREERTFSGKEGLVAQIHEDIARARELFDAPSSDVPS